MGHKGASRKSPMKNDYVSLFVLFMAWLQFLAAWKYFKRFPLADYMRCLVHGSRGYQRLYRTAPGTMV